MVVMIMFNSPDMGCRFFAALLKPQVLVPNRLAVLPDGVSVSLTKTVPSPSVDGALATNHITQLMRRGDAGLGTALIGDMSQQLVFTVSV